MRWLARQWHRVQLARELLEQYEWEEAHRVPFPEAMRLLEKWRQATRPASDDCGSAWSAAVKAKADRYPSG